MKTLLSLLLLLFTPIVLHTVVRIVRHFHKFPMPEFLADLIDNPLWRKFQPPAEMPIRHGIETGMTVLEVGPGNGRYTVETARRIGAAGKVIAVDIEPKMIERVSRRAQASASPARPPPTMTTSNGIENLRQAAIVHCRAGVLQARQSVLEGAGHEIK